METWLKDKIFALLYETGSKGCVLAKNNTVKNYAIEKKPNNKVNSVLGQIAKWTKWDLPQKQFVK